VLGYFLTMTLLEPLLRAGAPSRVVNVASALARGLDLTDVELTRRHYEMGAAYAQSKQADRMLTWAFARRTRGSGVTANAMHPGWVRTSLVRDGGVAQLVWSAASMLLARSPARGAETAVWLAAATALGDDTGGYYVDKKEKRCRYSDEEEQEKLWALCERMTAR
jgi:NAD(P)-dependent dehydrogenase (short-subunit alcohol dehydrogenase family)